MRARCCYCGIIDQNYNMTAVPTFKPKRDKWEKEFGLIFTIRCNSLDSPYICNTHIDGTKPEAIPVANRNLVYMDPDLADHVYFKFYAQEDIEVEYEKDNKSFEVKEEIDDDLDFEQPSCSYEVFDIPDDDVMKYYLVLADDSIIDCGFCYKTFPRSTTSTAIQKEHLMTHHSNEIKKLGKKENEKDHNGPYKRPKRFSKNLTKLSTEQEDYADNLLLQFIVNNGLSFKSIEDRNFQKLIFNLNPSYQAPTSDGLQILAKQIIKKKKKSEIGKYGPITITLDLCKRQDKTFLAFSVTHFPMEGVHHTDRSMFFREIPDYEQKVDVPVILRTIQSALDVQTSAQATFTNIVTSDPDLEEQFTILDCSTNVFLCFFSHINNFVNALMNIPVLSDGLNRMRKFIKEFPVDRNQWAKFRSFLVKRRTNCDFPDLDNEGWLSTINFLTKCLQMHRVFSEFMKINRKEGYIQADDHTNLVYFHTVLTTIKSIILKLSSTSATISQVIPAILEIKKSIELTTSCTTVFHAFYRVYAMCLNPLVESHDVYRFAVFLDPYQTVDNVFTDSLWKEVKRTLCTYLSFQTSGKSLISTYGGSLFKESAMIDKEVELYCEEVVENRPCDADASLSWWEGKEAKLPRLYNLAREILSVPIFAIDSKHFFGDSGQLNGMINELETDEQNLMLDLAGQLAEFKSRGMLAKDGPNLHKKKMNYIMGSESMSDKNEFLRKRMAGMSNRMMVTGYGKAVAEAIAKNNVVKKYASLLPFRSPSGIINVLPSSLKSIPDPDEKTMKTEEMSNLVKSEVVNSEIKIEAEEPNYKKFKPDENTTSFRNAQSVVSRCYKAEQNKIVTVIVDKHTAKPYPWRNTRQFNPKTLPVVDQKVVKKQYFVKGAVGKFQPLSK